MQRLRTGIIQHHRAGLSLRNPVGICGCLVAIILASVSVVRADTTWVLGGGVSGTWTLAGSPYMIHEGDIEVLASTELTIQPGVRAYFDGPFLLTVNGRVNAVGTAQDSITFTAMNVDTSQMAWRGILIDSSASDQSLFRYVVFEHANGRGVLPGGGGAVQIRGASATFQNCTFRANRSVPTREQQPISRNGGAVYLFGSDAVFDHCFFTGNDPGRIGRGGAVCCEDTTAAEFTDCMMQGNIAGSGGAVAILGANPQLLRCDLSQNVARYDGGAMLVDSGSGSFISCTMSENISSQSGGAISTFWHGSPLLEGCAIAGNQSFWGGAVYSGAECVPYFDHCVISNNIGGLGGALYAWRADPLLEFCTVAYNTSTTGHGGGMYINESQLWARHTIIAYSYGGEGVFFDESPEAVLQFCDIGVNSGGPIGYEPDQSAAPEGIGLMALVNANGDSCDAYMNIYSDPQFVAGGAGDFHLNWNSPCIDAGDPAEEHWDPDGTRLDLGAFYRDAVPVPEERTAVLQYELAQNFPNPFNAVTQIAFELPQAGETELSVYDLNGRLVTTLLSGDLVAGHHSVNFDAGTLPSGVYIYRLRANGIEYARKMVLLK